MSRSRAALDGSRGTSTPWFGYAHHRWFGYAHHRWRYIGEGLGDGW